MYITRYYSNSQGIKNSHCKYTEHLLTANHILLLHNKFIKLLFKINVFTAENFTSEIIILAVQRVIILREWNGSLPSVIKIISGTVCLPNSKRTEGRVKSKTE
jgi:hypothetical protein